MQDMDRPTASLIVRMRMALIDAGVAPPDDAEEDAAVTQAAFARVQRSPALLSERQMEDYAWGALAGESIAAGTGADRPVFANVKVVRLTPLDNEADARVLALPMRLDVIPLARDGESLRAGEMDVKASVLVPVGELAGVVQRIRPVASQFAWAASYGRFRLEAWAPSPLGDGVRGLTTLHCVAEAEGGLGLHVMVPGQGSDVHTVEFFRGRATPAEVADGRTTVMSFRFSSEPPPKATSGAG